MIRIDVDEVRSELNLTPFGAMGWLQNKNEACPFCGKSGKWAIKLSTEGGVCHCFRCGVKKGLKEYLKIINREDLIQIEYTNSLKTTLTELIPEVEDYQEEVGLKPITLPKRLKPLINDSYLDERGFTDYHYKEFEPCHTQSPLESKLKDYIIFKMKLEGETVAWLARSRKSKDWHKKNLSQYKKGKASLRLRYENSTGTDFTKLLGGYDELSKKTDTVIIVEGLFDKINIDNLLHLYEIEEVKCVFTFGNSVSKEQIRLIKNKNVKNVVLMYDDMTVEQSKTAGMMLHKHFQTKIAHLTKPGVDPGDMDIDYLEEILDRLEDPINFFVNKIPKRWE